MRKDNVFKGVLITAGSFVLWGILPLFWQLLFFLPHWSIICFRIVSSWIFLSIVITATGGWKSVVAIFSNKKELMYLLICGVMIGINWSIYILGIANNKVLETSMGYYINPIMNAIAGAIVFKEYLRPLQKLAIAVVCVGVGYMIFEHGEVPFFAIGLALSFTLYGTFHKLVKVNLFQGMFYEMTVLIIPCLIYLGFNFNFDIIAQKPLTALYITLAGVLTVAPLIGFAYGIRFLRLATVGIVQYFSPTVTFILGIFFFKEKFTPEMFVVFGFIWTGVVIYITDAILRIRRGQ